MIDVQAVLRDLPHFETFCSIEKLNTLVERLRANGRFTITMMGRSAGGVPIHDVCSGSGSVRALIVGFPHAMEPIGGMTAFSLLTLLDAQHPALIDADVEWHVVPCIDPDGAMLNEGWSQKPFSYESYMRHYYIQEPARQVDMSFPIRHKRMIWERPPPETQALKELIDRILPDFFFTLHNARMGGAFYYISHDIGRHYYDQIYRLLDRLHVPVQTHPQWQEVIAAFAPGVLEQWTHRKYYDYLEKLVPEPQQENLLRYGRHSVDYLQEIKPEALSFVAEVGYALHPDTESEKDTGEKLRRLMLRLDAENKYLGTVLLEEWACVRGELDPVHPIYRAVSEGWVLPGRETLSQGGFPLSRFPTQHIALSPEYRKNMTEADRFNACIVTGGWHYHFSAYELIRLLKESAPTPAVQRSIVRLEEAFAHARSEIARYVDLDAFTVIDCDTLVKVQLGSGLIALNSRLDAR